jgi:hypothetical protein
MKCKFFLYIFSFLFISAQSGPHTETHTVGATHYGAETLSSLKADGFIHLDGTHIINSTCINGHTDAKNTYFGELESNGFIKLDNCVVKGFATINGYLDAHHTLFEKEITISTEKSSFDSCSTASIVIKRKSSLIPTQVIEITGNSTIKGSIIFESKQGEVILSSGSEVLGKVHGGIITRK